MVRKIALVSVFLLAIALSQRNPAPASASAPRNDRWIVIGPGGGGAQFFPAISPHSVDDILVACDMTGAYISHDGGRTWRMFNLGGVVRFFVFDPVDPKTYYAGVSVGGGRALWRSSDAGATWRLVDPDPSTVRRVYQRDDHAANIFEPKPPAPGGITALAVDPSDSRTLYAVVRKGGAMRVVISSNGGKTWREGGEITGGGRSIFVDPNSPAADRTLYAIGDDSVAVRERGSWRNGPSAPEAGGFADAALGFRKGRARPVVYAINRGAVFVSEDGGASWSQHKLSGDSSGELRAIATAALDGDVAYVSYSRLRIGSGRFFGVAKTADAGRTWDLVWKESSRQPAPNMHDVWITPRFGPGWAESPLSLAVAAANPGVCVETDMGRTMRTTDGGRNWYGVYSTRLEDGAFTSTGLDVTTNYGVHFDPFDPKRLFISYTDIGLFRSENGGRAWVSASETVPRRWVNTTYWMVFDPAVRGRVWAVMSEVHDLPRPKMWRHTDPDTYAGGVVMSEDGGRTWRVSNQGMAETAATHMLLDPASPADARMLYVAGFGRGIYKSIDGGRSWVLKNDGLPLHQPFAWRLAMDSRRTLYVVIARRSEDGSFGNDRDGALYRSTDQAEHWTKLALPAGLNGPADVAIDPRDPQRLYLASWGRDVAGGAQSGGLWLSTDAGATWRNVFSPDQFIYSVTLDPRNPDIVYTCGFSSSAWCSADRGGTWRRIRGFNFKWGHRVVPDPLDPSRIFVTTFGGSVWYGPADGDPQAAEDIVTPGLAYSR